MEELLNERIILNELSTNFIINHYLKIISIPFDFIIDKELEKKLLYLKSNDWCVQLSIE